MKVLVSVLLLFITCGSSAAAEPVNLVTLLARGDDFAGKEVFVSGYVCTREESKAGLFLTLADCKDANFDNAIKIVPLKARTKVQDGRRTIQGIFKKEDVISTGSTYQWGRIEATTAN